MGVEIRLLAGVAGVRLALGVAAVGVLVARFDVAPQVLATHAALVVLACAVEGWGLAVLTSAPWLRRWRGAVAITALPAAASFGLVLLYAIDLTTNAMFGQNVTFAFVGRYLPHLEELVRSVPAPLRLVPPLADRARGSRARRHDDPTRRPAASHVVARRADHEPRLARALPRLRDRSAATRP